MIGDKQRMKKFVSAILALIMCLCPVPALYSGAFAASGTKTVSGSEVNLTYPGADTIVINGREIKSLSDESKFTVTVVVDDSSSAYNCFLLNGEKISDMSNGVNNIEIGIAGLQDKDNRLGAYIGTDSATYNDKMVYGSMNLDDVTIVSVSFNGVNFSSPSGTDLYYPIVGEAGNTVKRAAYSGNLRIGDGWFSDTKLGGSMPEMPMVCDFLFDKPDLSGIFVVDTTAFEDGEYDFVFKKGSETLETLKYRIDNTPPEIDFMINGVSSRSGASISYYDEFSVNIEDASNYSRTITIDGKSRGEPNLSSLPAGRHTVCVTAKDEFGNSSEKAFIFTLSEGAVCVSVNEQGKYSVSSKGSAEVYSAKLLKNIRMYENAYGTFAPDSLRSSDEVLVSYDEMAATPSVDGAFPYHSFVIDTEGKTEDLIISYKGAVGNNSQIELKAFNRKTSSWDVIGTVESGRESSFIISPSDYAEGDRIRINAFPKAVYNGSDTLVWNSDTQYYSRYEDLRPYYTKINEYTVAEYKAGNVGYYVHTGDLVDQTNVGDEIAHEQFRFASQAQKILDDNRVPNGVVVGNHDIQHTTANYDYYFDYFPESRYKDFEWYGGSLNNNMHHFDLVSLGEYDFVFIYLGCYKEAEPDTIAWVDSVCKAFPERNVVLCTHEYLLPSGAYSGDRARVIWDEMVVPNDNVVMILCGHNEGVCDRQRTVEGTNRKVLEILADYQFAENGMGPQHVENNCTCDGEGYIRLMKFTSGGQMISTTYSPVAEEYGIDPYNYYPSYMDSFVYDIDFRKSDRSLKTESFVVAVADKKLGDANDEGLELKGDAFFAVSGSKGKKTYSGVYLLKEFKNSYPVDEKPEYKNSDTERFGTVWDKYVLPTLRRGEANAEPGSDVTDKTIELMPESVKELQQTSGSGKYELTVDEDGTGFTIHHQHDGFNWVTLQKNVFKDIDVSETPRLYFGVTAPKDAKWNLELNFTGVSYSFSRTKEYAELFGYVNSLPSDIQGTWQGYIDLSRFISGKARLNSIYFVTATPDATVHFDYLFIGTAKGGSVSFICDDFRALTFDAAVGEKIPLPDQPYLPGKAFEGWYTEKSGGTRVEGDVSVENGVKTLYARFTQAEAKQDRSFAHFNDELPFKSSFNFNLLIIIVCAVISAAAIAIIILNLKTKKSNSAKEN